MEIGTSWRLSSRLLAVTTISSRNALAPATYAIAPDDGQTANGSMSKLIRVINLTGYVLVIVFPRYRFLLFPGGRS